MRSNGEGEWPREGSSGATRSPTALPGPLQGLLRAASRSGSIEQPPRYSAIKMSDSRTDKCRRGEVRRVHGHCPVALPTSIRVVSNATTSLAPVVVANPPVPRVLRETILRSFNGNRSRPVVRPECTVATADRAIAAHYRAGQLPNMKPNRATVAGGDRYGGAVSHGA